MGGLIALFLALLSAEALSQEPPSLAEVVSRTLQNLPQLKKSQAFKELATAWKERGGFWLAGPTTLGASFEHFPDTGAWGGGLELTFTLWKWNQKRGALEVAEEAEALPDLFRRYLRWEASGLVRELVWEVRLLESRLRFSQERLERARRLLKAVERQVAAGELGERDLLLARSDYLRRLIEHHRLEVETTHARHRYRLLTGLERLPEKISERLSSRKLQGHPLLRFLQARVRLLEARSRYARFESDTGDQQAFLSLGSRHQKGGDHGFVLSLTYPFGASPYNAPNVAEWRSQAVEAEVQLHQAHRDLRLRLEEATHRLELDRFRLSRLREQEELARKQLELADRLFEAGELALLDLLRIQEQALQALQEAEVARIEYQRDIAQYNQVVGETL